MSDAIEGLVPSQVTPFQRCDTFRNQNRHFLQESGGNLPAPDQPTSLPVSDFFLHHRISIRRASASSFSGVGHHHPQALNDAHHLSNRVHLIAVGGLVRLLVVNLPLGRPKGGGEAGLLLKKSDFLSDRISVIPQYGVNPQLFRKKMFQGLKKLGLGVFIVGYLGRLVPEKGIHHLLGAFAMVPKPKANLLIIGNSLLRVELEKKSLQLCIASQIRWVAAIDQPHVHDYLHCMNVLVLPLHHHAHPEGTIRPRDH